MTARMAYDKTRKQTSVLMEEGNMLESVNTEDNEIIEPDVQINDTPDPDLDWDVDW
jgi:hypothetical protein